MSTTRIVLAVLLLDLILVPPLLIITFAAGRGLVASITSKFGRLAMPFICTAVFVAASSFGYWIIDSDQKPIERATIYQDDEGDTRDDCERHPGIYGC